MANSGRIPAGEGRSWPERTVVRTGVSPINPKVKWAHLDCGHEVWRARRPRIGARIVCEKCSEGRPTPPPRLRWRRSRSGKYWAGPYVVERLPHHRPVWILRRNGEALMHRGSAAEAKQSAADDYVARKGADDETTT